MTDQQAAQTDTGAVIVALEEIKALAGRQDRPDNAAKGRALALIATKAHRALAALRATTPATAGAREIAAWSWLASRTNFELSFGFDDPEGPSEWRVHSVNGGVNDREWTLRGTGSTPLEAVQDAAVELTIAAKSAPPAQPAGGIANVIRKLRARKWIDCNKADAELDGLAASLLERLSSPGGGSREEVAKTVARHLIALEDNMLRNDADMTLDRDGSPSPREMAAMLLGRELTDEEQGFALRPSGPQAAEGDAK